MNNFEIFIITVVLTRGKTVVMKTRVVHVSRLSRHNWPDTGRLFRLCGPCTNLAHPHPLVSQIHHLQHRKHQIMNHEDLTSAHQCGRSARPARQLRSRTELGREHQARRCPAARSWRRPTPRTRRQTG